jgi:RNA polymerase sigma-32 factor
LLLEHRSMMRPPPAFSAYKTVLDGMELAELRPMDPLYFDRVLDLELLSHKEESALARRWRKLGDQTARNLLIQAHLRLVPPIARRYHRPGASLSELIAEGNFGLLRASAKFEPQRGYRFATYARYWIRACVSECAIRNSGAAMTLPRTLRKVRREHARATAIVGGGIDVRRIIAERLQMNPGTVDDLVGLLHRRQVSFESLHSEWQTDEPLYAREVSPEQEMVNKTERQLLGEAVRSALVSLNARERRIVDRRLMADAEAMLTLKELGREFGVSRERVRQLEVNIKRKLVTHFRALSKTSEARASKVAA